MPDQPEAMPSFTGEAGPASETASVRGSPAEAGGVAVAHHGDKDTGSISSGSLTNSILIYGLTRMLFFKSF